MSKKKNKKNKEPNYKNKSVLDLKKELDGYEYSLKNSNKILKISKIIYKKDENIKNLEILRKAYILRINHNISKKLYSNSLDLINNLFLIINIENAYYIELKIYIYILEKNKKFDKIIEFFRNFDLENRDDKDKLYKQYIDIIIIYWDEIKNKININDSFFEFGRIINDIINYVDSGHLMEAKQLLKELPSEFYFNDWKDFIKFYILSITKKDIKAKKIIDKLEKEEHVFNPIIPIIKNIFFGEKNLENDFSIKIRRFLYPESNINLINLFNEFQELYDSFDEDDDIEINDFYNYINLFEKIFNLIDLNINQIKFFEFFTNIFLLNLRYSFDLLKSKEQLNITQKIYKIINKKNCELLYLRFLLNLDVYLISSNILDIYEEIYENPDEGNEEKIVNEIKNYISDIIDDNGLFDDINSIYKQDYNQNLDVDLLKFVYLNELLNLILSRYDFDEDDEIYINEIIYFILEKSISFYNKDLDTNKKLLEISLKLDKSFQKSAFDIVSKNFPDNIEINFLYINYIIANAPTKKIKCYEKLLKVNPFNEIINRELCYNYSLLARKKSFENNYKLAEKYYKKALKINNKFLQIFDNPNIKYGVLLAKKGDIKNAVKIIENNFSINNNKEYLKLMVLLECLILKVDFPPYSDYLKNKNYNIIDINEIFNFIKIIKAYSFDFFKYFTKQINHIKKFLIFNLKKNKFNENDLLLLYEFLYNTFIEGEIYNSFIISILENLTKIYKKKFPNNLKLKFFVFLSKNLDLISLLKIKKYNINKSKIKSFEKKLNEFEDKFIENNIRVYIGEFGYLKNLIENYIFANLNFSEKDFEKFKKIFGNVINDMLEGNEEFDDF